MEITSALAAGQLVSGALGELAKRVAPPETSGGTPVDSLAAVTGSNAETVAAFRQILVDYDVTDISPSEFSRMIQRLQSIGALPEETLHELAQIRLDLDLAQADPHDRTNLVEFYLDKIRDLRLAPDDTEDAPPGADSLVAAMRRLDWMEKFATIQSSADQIGIDMTA
ncbi:MAG: hypothetical protein ACYSWU_27655 [Planctomycetota bacterium]|jgi:hypothetical protein